MPQRAALITLLLTAVAATGVSVLGGVVAGPGAAQETAVTPVAGTERAPDLADQDAPDKGRSAGSRSRPGAVTAAELGEREAVVSRSDRRTEADPAKERALAAEDAPAMTASESVADDDPREIAQALMPQFGFSSDQFGCLDSLWTKESGWDPSADNPTSSAYGIPQSLPGEKMASAGADWATNPATQIRWGLGYIQDVYGSPCSAWSHSQANDWY